MAAHDAVSLGAAVAASYSIAEVMRRLGLRNSGGMHSFIKRKIVAHGFDTSHFLGQRVSRLIPRERVPWQVGLVDRTLFGRRTAGYKLRRWLIESGVPYKCRACNMEPVWQGRPITLEVNHINGNPFDNTRSNLEFLCPNCHSQIPTHSGPRPSSSPSQSPVKSVRSKGSSRWQKCTGCGKPSTAPKCKRCCRLKPLNGVTDQELAKLVWDIPTSEIAKRFGVSDVAIAHRCAKRGIPKPSRGYWTKRKRA